ncbi:MAG: polysaccharide biosynthesis C-terminal domain-containing protein [Alcaligenaceae bacterium]|nr:polysaccharide biosynthesis C-terminal domain-containing protein [Alcaligenaceae bacterium]
MNFKNPLIRIGFAEVFAKVLSWASLAIIPFFASPVVYGEVSLNYSMILLFLPLFLFGQDRLILKGEPGKELIVSFKFTIVVWLLTSVILLLFDLFFIAFAALFLTLNKLYLTYYRAEEKYNCYALNRVIYSVFRLIFVVAVVYFFYSPTAYIFSELFAAGLATVAMFVFIVKSGFFQKFDFTKRFLHGFPLMLHGVSLLGIGVADRFILKTYVDFDAVGNYSFIYVFASGLIFLFSIVSIIYEKKIYKSDDRKSLLNNVKQTLGLMLGIGLIGSFVSIVLFTLIFKFNLIKGYGFYINELVLLLLAHAILPFYLVSNYILIQQDKAKLLLLTSFVSFAVNVAFNLYLIPQYGLQGAVWATLMANFMLVIFVMVMCAQVLKKNESYK